MKRTSVRIEYWATQRRLELGSIEFGLCSIPGRQRPKTEDFYFSLRRSGMLIVSRSLNNRTPEECHVSGNPNFVFGNYFDPVQLRHTSRSVGARLSRVRETINMSLLWSEEIIGFALERILQTQPPTTSTPDLSSKNHPATAIQQSIVEDCHSSATRRGIVPT